MLEWLKSFFFNAGVFKGTVRGLAMGTGIAIAALPPEIIGELPSWMRISGVVLAALGGFLRSSQHQRRPMASELRTPSPVKAPTPPPEP